MDAQEEVDPGGEDQGAGTTAILRFHNTATGSGISRRGPIRPGGQLTVEYDPARLQPSTDTVVTGREIVCHVQFDPGSHHYTEVATESRVSTAPAHVITRHVSFAMLIPRDVTGLQIWFESRRSDGAVAWDSRYGQNYVFAVVGDGLPLPVGSVVQRAGVIVDPSKIRVLEDAASKATTVSGSTGKRLHTGLFIRARVEETSADVWADIHVFDGVGELIHTGNVILHRDQSDTDGTVFLWEDDIYQGSGGGSGIGVWTKPDAHLLQYRLYCRVQRPVFEIVGPILTDGVLHEFEVPADEDVEDGSG